MTLERWQQIDALLQAALEQPKARRAAFLQQACAGDTVLLQEVESLLGFEPDNEDFLAAPPAAVAARMLQTDTAEHLIGRKLGRYELQSALGRGGMGVVYLAQDTQLGRKVALKLLSRRFTSDAEHVRRFRQEARAVSALNHPNILTIHEIGEAETANGNTHFIATEFVEGRTLRAVLNAASPESSLTLGVVLDVLIQTATALVAAHQAGIIHRDIKPENLMLRPDGVVKVLDFGLAKLTVRETAAAAAFSTVHTNPGLIMGTVSYMSPEQARGLDVDARSDIFSLGVVMYELLTGRPAFAGATTGDVLVSLLEREPLPLKHYAPHIPAELQNIVSRAVAKDCAARYQSCADLLNALKTLKQELELTAHLKRAGDTPANAASLGLRVGHTTKDEASIAEKATAPTTQNAARPTNKSLHLFRHLPRPSKALALAAALTVALGGVATWRHWNQIRLKLAATFPTTNAIAVLPFVNTDGGPQMEYLSDGLTESLMQNLQQVPGLRVMAHGTVFSYKGRDVDPRQIGQALQVQAVINGRVQKQGEQLLIRVELADTRDGTRLWGDNYQSTMKDLATVQAELSRAVSEQLAKRSGVQLQAGNAPPQTQNAEAYRLYLLGRHYLEKHTREDGEKALNYFQQALALDPQYALAHVGIAYHYASLSSRLLPPQEAMSKARQAALRALQLNPNLAEAYFSLALVKAYGDWDWVGAEAEIRRALALNPNLAEAHTVYADLLSLQKRFVEFESEIQLAQLIDPLSSFALEIHAWGLYFAGRYDDALSTCLKLQELDPTYHRVYMHLGYIYGQKGQLPEAIAAVKKGLALKRHEHLLTALAYLYGVSGQPQQARQLQAELEQLARQKGYVSPYLFAKIHVGLGEYERAMARIQETYDIHSESLMSLGIDPLFQPLHTNPRFKELVSKIGLQP